METIVNLQQKIEEQQESIRKLMQLSLKHYSDLLGNTQTTPETGNVMATLTAAQSISDHNKNLLSLVAQNPVFQQLNEAPSAPKLAVVSEKKESNKTTKDLLSKLLEQLQQQQVPVNKEPASGGTGSSQIEEESDILENHLTVVNMVGSAKAKSESTT